MDQTELNKIVEQITQHKIGCKANLSEANLSEANLSEANLSGADLSGAYIRLSNVSFSDLLTDVIDT